MNIYALPGSKVVVTEKSIKNGYTSDKEYIKKHCEIGKVYTVVSMVVHSSTSAVYLKEFPNIAFNSVMFEDYGSDIALVGAVVKYKKGSLKIKYFPTTQAAVDTFLLIDGLEYRDVSVDDMMAEVCDDPLELKAYRKFAWVGAIEPELTVSLLSKCDGRALVVSHNFIEIMQYIAPSALYL